MELADINLGTALLLIHPSEGSKYAATIMDNCSSGTCCSLIDGCHVLP